MSFNCCELIVEPASRPSSRSHNLLDDAGLRTTTSATRSCIVLTDRQSPREEIVNDLALHGIEHMWLVRINQPVDAMDSGQIISLFETAINTNPATKSSSLFVADLDRVSVEIVAALAAATNAMSCGACRQITVTEDGKLQTEKSGFGGRLIISQTWEGLQFFACLRPSRPIDAPRPGATLMATTPQSHEQTLATLPEATFTVTHDAGSSADSGLANARLVVSGGRGIKTPENFALVHALADEMGAAVGASLPAVDAGLAPATRQVGQSGNYVKPQIYVAVAISGTPQHLAGIDPVTRIVAINSDIDAHIFKVSEIGVVAECESFLPLLLQEMRSSGQQDR